MEILFSDKYYDRELGHDGKYARELSEFLKQFDNEVTVDETDIGHGADWPVVLVEIFKSNDWSKLATLAGAAGIFLLGDLINKNIDGWISLASKFQAIVSKIAPARIDETGAILIVIDDLIKCGYQIGNIKLTLQVIQFSQMPSGVGHLDKSPDSLFLVTAEAGDNVEVYGIKSNNKLQFKHSFNRDWIGF